MMQQNPSGPVDRTVGRDVEWDVLAEYSRADGHREWVNVGTWLLPGDAVVQISVAELDRLRAERDELREALAQERHRCAVLCIAQQTEDDESDSGRAYNDGCFDCASTIMLTPNVLLSGAVRRPLE